MIGPFALYSEQEAIEYYGGEDLFLFDEFQTGREPSSRRPLVRNLYDVFSNIRCALARSCARASGVCIGCLRPRVSLARGLACDLCLALSLHRDDELEHVKTMFQCQTAESAIVSPNTRKATAEARARK